METGTGTFDYVAYDDKAQSKQMHFKSIFETLEKDVAELLPAGRASALVKTYSEVCYMWVGKAIRDEQISRNGSAPLQEERTNS